MPNHRSGGPTRVRAAAYLRCHPYDIWQTGPHYWITLQRAHDLALPVPDIYFDNGCLASGPLPRLRRLFGAIEDGHYDVVLLPGPFVLSLDDAKAERMVRWMRGHGCRVDELPALSDGALPAVDPAATVPRPDPMPAPLADCVPEPVAPEPVSAPAPWPGPEPAPDPVAPVRQPAWHLAAEPARAL